MGSGAPGRDALNAAAAQRNLVFARSRTIERRDDSVKSATMTTEHVLVRFARDFSKNDPEMIARAEKIAASPPTRIEEIGFYGAEDDGPENRAYLATVSMLNEAGHVEDVEDKYVPEILLRWRDAGRFATADLPPAALTVFGPMLGEANADFAGEDGVRRYAESFRENYAEAVTGLERALVAKGEALLSIDATSGDTMFFAFVSPEIAERWRDRALGDGKDYVGGVRSPMWDRLYAFLGYALRLYDQPSWREDPPPGTPGRKPDIPVAR